MMNAISVRYEDNHLLAVDKPAGRPTQPDDSGDPSELDVAREYIRVRYAKPGQVYLAPVHRLDRPVSGVLLFARTDKAAGRLAEQFRRRGSEDGSGNASGPEKIYDAFVELHRPPPPADAEGQRHDHLLEILPAGGVRVLSAFPDAGASADPAGRHTPPRRHDRRDGEAKVRRASLIVRLREVWSSGASTAGSRAWVEVRLLTGVKHQIRAQLAYCGWPVAGDFRYGPEGRRADPAPLLEGRAIALHARRLTVQHPTLKTPLTIEAPLPSYWNRQ